VTLSENDTIACEKAILDDVTIQRLSKGRSSGNVDCAVLLKQLVAANISAQNNQEDLGTHPGLVISGDQSTMNFRSGTASDVTRINLPAHFGSLKQIFNLENYM